MSTFPIVSFLHVPGKMSKPLWLMLGTAFRVKGPPELERLFFLTCKHTFEPWNYMKDSTQLKIPDEYRKARYVICKMYGCEVPTSSNPPRPLTAVASENISATLHSVHPHLDVALLTVRKSGLEQVPFASKFSAAPALSLSTAAPASDQLCVIEGYRGIGVLGELDTLDVDILQTLDPRKRAELFKSLDNVEGRQELATTTVEILSDRGMCRGVDFQDCYHGMSGSPVLTPDKTEVIGILYGVHPDYQQNVGFIPTEAYKDWLEEQFQHMSKPSLSS